MPWQLIVARQTHAMIQNEEEEQVSDKEMRPG
jgi:hypothetical protein